jgi:PhnB protein
MRMDVYVNYRGMCEEAFRFYEEHLGGHVTLLVRHGDQPNPSLPSGWGDKVLHARLEIGSAVLMGADIPGAEPMRSAYLTLSLGSAEEAERVYGALCEGGQVLMRMIQTPFANRFAQVRDRFGASWMLLHEASAPGR